MLGVMVKEATVNATGNTGSKKNAFENGNSFFTIYRYNDKCYRQDSYITFRVFPYRCGKALRKKLHNVIACRVLRIARIVIDV